MRPRYACPKGRTGVVQAKVPAHLLEGSWPTEALLAQIAVSKHSEHMPLNRQAIVMARHGVPIERSVLADWMGRTGALIAPVVDHMAKRLMADSTRLYVDETTAPVLDRRPMGLDHWRHIGQPRHDEDRLPLGRLAR